MEQNFKFINIKIRGSLFKIVVDLVKKDSFVSMEMFEFTEFSKGKITLLNLF